MSWFDHCVIYGEQRIFALLLLLLLLLFLEEFLCNEITNLLFDGLADTRKICLLSFQCLNRWEGGRVMARW